MGSRLAGFAVALLMAAALAACGAGSTAHSSTTTTTRAKPPARPYVDIYAGLPLSGPLAKQGKAVWNGIELAARNAHSRGGVSLRFKAPLNDAGKKTGDGNLARTVAHAIRVSTDPHAVYYIGDLSSAATGVSLPILNAAGIAQITPGDPYVAPSSTQAGAAASLSTKILRLLPSYLIQAPADMQFFEQIPPRLKLPACTRVDVITESDPESLELAKLMAADAKSYGVQKLTPLALTTKTVTAATYEAAFPGQLPCGFVIAGSAVKPAVTVTKAIYALFPKALILGTSGICNSRWTKAADKGVPADVDHVLWCTSPTWPLSQYADIVNFKQLYRNTYKSTPSAYALYGFEAANLGIAMLNSLGTSAENRSVVRDNLFNPQIRDGFQYANLASGQSSLSSYALYNVGLKSGAPTFYRTLKP